MENITHLNGSIIHIAGNFICSGIQAPPFSLITRELERFSLTDAKGKNLLLNIFPSTDTGVCAMSVRKFNELASKIPNTTILCISKDLPFAQVRFCAAEGIENVIMLSDFHYKSTFGKDYGVLMEDGPLSGLLARSVIIINESGKVIYSEKVNEIKTEPNYDAALKALKK